MIYRASDVTIVIPTIPGREALLARALASVDQLERPPGDVRVVTDVDRHGAAWARNTALAAVDTPLVAWLDDDDELLPNHLKVLLRGLHNNVAQMCFSYAEFVGGRDPLATCLKGQLIAKPVNVRFGPEQAAHLSAHKGKLCPYCGYERGGFIPITYLIETDAVRDVGGFPEPYSADHNGADCEDFLLLLRLLDAGVRLSNVPGVITWRYHIHAENTGGRGADRIHELDDPPPGHQVGANREE
jgi:glycosyltransferase involved in cell wall biosynthesis